MPRKKSYIQQDLEAEASTQKRIDLAKLWKAEEDKELEPSVVAKLAHEA